LPYPVLIRTMDSARAMTVTVPLGVNGARLGLRRVPPLFPHEKPGQRPGGRHRIGSALGAQGTR